MAKKKNGAITPIVAYNTKIAPIVDHLNASCRQYGITNLTAFSIPETADTGQIVASVQPDAQGRLPSEFMVMLAYLKGDTGLPTRTQ
jgi:hypothetical protein